MTSNQETDQELADSMYISRTMRLYFPHFFDNIGVNYTNLRRGRIHISDQLADSKSSLLFNRDFMSEQDQARFPDLLEKYTQLISSILNPQKCLFTYVNKKIDRSDPKKWRKIKDGNILDEIFSNRNYQCISPLAVMTIVFNIYRTYEESHCRGYIFKQLNDINKKLLDILREFKTKLRSNTKNYVYNYPSDENQIQEHTTKYVNSVMTNIYDATDAMLKIKIYNIYSLLNDELVCCLPVDSINYDLLNGVDKIHVV